MPKKLTTEEFITKATIVHGTKYDYTDVVYTNAKTKVSIICPFHNSFSQNPSTHLSGSGCVLCARERSKKKLSLRGQGIFTETYMTTQRLSIKTVTNI